MARKYILSRYNNKYETIPASKGFAKLGMKEWILTRVRISNNWATLTMLIDIATAMAAPWIPYCGIKIKDRLARNNKPNIELRSVIFAFPLMSIITSRGPDMVLITWPILKIIKLVAPAIKPSPKMARISWGKIIISKAPGKLIKKIHLLTISNNCLSSA